MLINDFCGKIHLPSAVAHFGWDTPKIYRKLPSYGWYGQSQNEDMTFNCISLYRYCNPDYPKNDDLGFISSCYRYYTQDHPELLETPLNYSETTETRLINDYLLKCAQHKFYRLCRLEALEGSVNYQARSWKFTKLLEELGMSNFIDAGIGVAASKIVNYRDFDILNLRGRVDKNVILIPSYFAPNDNLASLELATLGDIGKRRIIYRNREFGWYGSMGSNVVGSIQDLLTTPGCTWHPNLALWPQDKPLKLHHSLKPNQCIEIWSNMSNLVTDKNPLSLIDKKQFKETLKTNLSKLNIGQIHELEKITGEQLKAHWLSVKTCEAEVSGIRFVSNKGKYYYIRNNHPHEYTNFTVEFTKIKKESGEFYQYGYVTMHETSVAFKLKRKCFASQYHLINELTNITLEAGLGVPMIAPNLKHYIINVIESFNPVNLVDKPKPAVKPIELDKERELDPDL